jgi:ABC-type Fe3+ transport system permease subunit
MASPDMSQSHLVNKLICWFVAASIYFCFVLPFLSILYIAYTLFYNLTVFVTHRLSTFLTVSASGPTLTFALDFKAARSVNTVGYLLHRHSGVAHGLHKEKKAR